VTRLDHRLAVRVARPQDEAGLARLEAVAWTAASGFPSVTERAHDPFFSFFTGSGPPREYLVAELEGRLAGYIRVRPVSELPESGHVLGVMGLAVAPGAGESPRRCSPPPSSWRAPGARASSACTCSAPTRRP
jgi:hypothetical protein